MKTRYVWATFVACLLSACNGQDPSARAVGQLESERIELTAVAAEQLASRSAAEGSRVAAGDVLFELDNALAQARLEEAEAQVAQYKSALEELLEGTRIEQLQAARAEVAGARKERVFRVNEVKRFEDLAARDLASDEQLDSAQVALDTAIAKLDAATARLQELTRGPRQQTIEQGAARLQLAQANLKARQILLDRYSTRAPAAGVLDHYLFEIGERPSEGQVVAVMLAGDQPYARVYIPADIRSDVHVGDPVAVHVEGFASAVEGKVRWISSEAAFTPYFALTEYDRNRLSYLAKIDLAATERRLPDGVPVEVDFAPGSN